MSLNYQERQPLFDISAYALAHNIPICNLFSDEELIATVAENAQDNSVVVLKDLNRAQYAIAGLWGFGFKPTGHLIIQSKRGIFFKEKITVRFLLSINGLERLRGTTPSQVFIGWY